MTKSVLRRLQPATDWMAEHAIISILLILMGLLLTFYCCIVRPMSQEGTTEYTAVKMDPKSD
jgi:hypothetical protein